MLKFIFFVVFAIVFCAGLMFRMPTLILAGIGGIIATALLPIGAPQASW